MDLYTFFMEFRGGTYISQVEATSERQAVKRWADQLNPQEVQDFDEQSKEQLIMDIPEMIEEEMVASVDSLENVWSFTYQFPKGFAFINFVKTMDEI